MSDKEESIKTFETKNFSQEYLAHIWSERTIEQSAQYSESKFDANLAKYANYYNIFDNKDKFIYTSIEFPAVGTTIGGGFDLTSKSIPQKYKKAMMDQIMNKYLRQWKKKHKHTI